MSSNSPLFADLLESLKSSPVNPEQNRNTRLNFEFLKQKSRSGGAAEIRRKFQALSMQQKQAVVESIMMIAFRSPDGRADNITACIEDHLALCAKNGAQYAKTQTRMNQVKLFQEKWPLLKATFGNFSWLNICAGIPELREGFMFRDASPYFFHNKGRYLYESNETIAAVVRERTEVLIKFLPNNFSEDKREAIYRVAIDLPRGKSVTHHITSNGEIVGRELKLVKYVFELYVMAATAAGSDNSRLESYARVSSYDEVEIAIDSMRQFFNKLTRLEAQNNSINMRPFSV